LDKLDNELYTRFVQEGTFVFITGRRQDELDKAVKHVPVWFAGGTGRAVQEERRKQRATW